MNPTPHIIPSALLLLAAFFIGCLIGYVLKQVFGPRKAATSEPDTAEQTANERDADAPVVIEEAPVAEPDDLTKIKGIGPKTVAMLHENGIYRFDQIATWDAEAIEDMNERMSFRSRVERENWIEQARDLAGK
ncbi:MAG TPA: helix-hairpin-helix domain-containing protein [Pelagibacterium sp.]|uniref:helix-hairpin-helix domain-containing protein n=1 Tax=Pelagibacterium sp. TaxID=1967288 RepID=UPI002C568F3E|nr:helix-hairpin-helix domain-containing protein [Pelagibacterium sp.]HWJ87391.1 helix-hairpin-helix domain-containing protein [Pelagibacterium sp.]